MKKTKIEHILNGIILAIPTTILVGFGVSSFTDNTGLIIFTMIAFFSEETFLNARHYMLQEKTDELEERIKKIESQLTHSHRSDEWA